jgi:ubiquinone biosynthesis protein
VFHGDIHPGNIILGPDSHLVFLDTGAISEVGLKIRRGLFRFFVALCEYDYPTCAVRLNEMAETGISGAKLERFIASFIKLYQGFEGRTVSEVSLTKQMMESIKLAVNCGMVFEKGMFSIIKSMMYLDGMVLRCNPKADLIKDMKARISDFQKVLSMEENE